MHSKKKGNVGQLATAFCLSKLGFSVFLEAGDISKIDLIAEKNGKIITFQCKAITIKRGQLEVPLRKCGPNYSVKYKEEQFDFFSVYDLINERLYLLPSKVLRDHDTSFCLRVDFPKNRQYKKLNLAEDYLAERILRDFTDGTQSSNVEGDDKVQTATGNG